MKTMVTFSMALATLVLATAADADVRDRGCRLIARGFLVRPGTPCLIPMGIPGYATKIIEPPHHGVAVVRADGSIYYSPKPGFTGIDNSMRVRHLHWGAAHPSSYDDFLGAGSTLRIFINVF
jgi:hypothetical protein